jgi:hypothetical protein
VSETIPMEMLKTLNHAQKLLFDEPEKKVEAAIVAAAPSDGSQTDTPPAETPQEGSKDAAGKQDA